MSYNELFGQPTDPDNPFPVIPKPPKDECFVCKRKETDNDGKLQRCSRCRTVPYCSKECQKADWQSHKEICIKYIASNMGTNTTTTMGERGPKGRRAVAARTRNEIMGDLIKFAQEHNGDSFTLACWHAMGLVKNIERRKTHFLGVTLKRNFEASSNRRLYSLIDAEVLPMSVLETKFASSGILTPNGEEIPGFTPIDMLKRDEESRKGENDSLGSVLVISIELNEKEENRTVEEAILKTANPGIQPLGLFPVHRDSMKRNLSGLGSDWKLCLRNALNGGRYGPRFAPWIG